MERLSQYVVDFIGVFADIEKSLISDTPETDPAAIMAEFKDSHPDATKEQFTEAAQFIQINHAGIVDHTTRLRALRGASVVIRTARILFQK